jgi:benzoylformate decarboxylase
MTTVRDAAFAVFAHFGVDRLFGNPGSTELPMLKGLPFPYVMGLNEAVVMGMADGYARSTGRAALVNLHSSAGTGHSLGNLFTAFKNNAPIVVTAGQQARSILPHDPFLGAERPSEFPRPFVKFSIEPARAADVPLALASG